MLDLVRMSPLQWGVYILLLCVCIKYLKLPNNSTYFPEITINDIIVKAQEELSCALGECISVGVGVCNALEHPLSDLTLSINFYQDHHNGVNNYQLETRLSIAGANKVMLPTVSHNFQMQFVVV